MVIIGLDPHPGTHTAAALDEHGTLLGSLTIGNSLSGITELATWVQSFPDRVWAVEGANNPFTRQLTGYFVGAGERLHHIHPGLTSQYRARRSAKKNDQIDAVNAARVLLANPSLPVHRLTAEQLQLQLLARNRDRLATHLKANRMALRSLPEGVVGDVVRIPLEGVVEALKTALKQIEGEMLRLVTQEAPKLLDLHGVGAVLAAAVLAEVGDVTRFASAHHFASFCGAAPVPRSSGGTTKWCVSRGGNRRLNRALHLVALTRYRRDDTTRSYIEKKRREGKSFREAMRALKTVIARELFKTLQPALAP
jgi:transposase